MRALAIIFLLSVLVVGLSLLTLQYLHISAENLIQEITIAQQQIEAGNWTLAQEQLENFAHSWNKIQQKWTIFLNHQEIDQIDLALARLLSFSKACDYNQSLAELAALKLLLSHIPEKENLNLPNIF
ncbi:MAG: DUF4363 family protein [Bacillota bacterium]|jgi:hypothetical protein